MVKFYDSEIRVDCAVESDNFSFKMWVLMHGPKTAKWYLAGITKNRRTKKNGLEIFDHKKTLMVRISAVKKFPWDPESGV